MLFTPKVATKSWTRYQWPSPKIFEESSFQLWKAHNQILPNQIKSCGLRNLLHFGHQSLQADEWVVSLNRLNGAMPGLKLSDLQQYLEASHGKIHLKISMHFHLHFV